MDPVCIVGQKIGRASKCGSVRCLLQPHPAMKNIIATSVPEGHSSKNSEDDQSHHDGHLAFAQDMRL